MRINSIIKTKFYSPEQVDSFLFLGNIITKKWWRRGRCEEKRRQANGTLIQLYPVWKNENISRRTKLRLFNRNVKSFSSYGCETWKVTEPIVRETQVSINRCSGRIVNMSWPQVISNEDLREMTNQQPIRQQITESDCSDG